MQLVPCNIMTRLTAILSVAALFSSTVVGQTATQVPPDSPQPQTHSFELKDYSKPYSHFPNPIKPYIGHEISAPTLTNTPRLDQLMQNG